MSMPESCMTCKLNNDPSGVPGGRIKEYKFWILEHIIEPIPVKGWLVLKTKRHADGVIGLNEMEAEEFGLILNTLPKIQKSILGAAQIYVCCFTEEVSHIHFHFIPRYPEETLKGPHIFGLLRKVKNENSKAIPREEAIKFIDEMRCRL